MQFIAVQLHEGVDHVRAQVGVDVLGQILAVARAILRPVGVIAHELECIARS